MERTLWRDCGAIAAAMMLAAAPAISRLMPRRAVQALLLDIARAPRDRAYVDAALWVD